MLLVYYSTCVCKCQVARLRAAPARLLRVGQKGQLAADRDQRARARAAAVIIYAATWQWHWLYS
jgi:hypothetical protein